MENSFYRPAWTCGRYNAEKHVALMYNLIAGYSYFFDSYSADVVGQVLNVKRNANVSIKEVARATGIAEESVEPFFQYFVELGLLVSKIPTKDDILRYRTQLADFKRKQQSVEKTTQEKLPMETSNAEQAYYEAVETDGVVTSVNCNWMTTNVSLMNLTMLEL